MIASRVRTGWVRTRCALAAGKSGTNRVGSYPMCARRRQVGYGPSGFVPDAHATDDRRRTASDGRATRRRTGDGRSAERGDRCVVVRLLRRSRGRVCEWMTVPDSSSTTTARASSPCIRPSASLTPQLSPKSLRNVDAVSTLSIPSAAQNRPCANGRSADTLSTTVLSSPAARSLNVRTLVAQVGVSTLGKMLTIEPLAGVVGWR